MSKDRYRPSTADREVVRTATTFLNEGQSFDDGFDDGFDGPGDEQADIPGTLRVISQKLRHNEQGVLVVDVTLGWDAIDGVDEYRVRVAKS